MHCNIHLYTAQHSAYSSAKFPRFCLTDKFIGMTVVLPLQRLCLISIVDTLEQLPVDHLSLLPAHLRYEILRNLPVVDICKLERTSFVAGLDTERIWAELVEKHTKYYYCLESFPIAKEKALLMALQELCSSKKDLYFCTISGIILNNLRPCGFWSITQQRYVSFTTDYYEVDDVGVGDPVPLVPDDIVNYLIATSREDLELIDEVSVTSEDFVLTHDEKCSPLTCSERANRKWGQCELSYRSPLWEPIQKPWKNEFSACYNEACLRHHYVPKRYLKYLQSDLHRISDEKAIAVITEECGYSPSACVIGSNIKKRWATNLMNISFARLFRGLQCLTIDCECEHTTSATEDCNVALEAVISYEKPCLSTLRLSCVNEWETCLGKNTIESLLCKLQNLHTLHYHKLLLDRDASQKVASRIMILLKAFIARPHFQCLVLTGMDYFLEHVQIGLVSCFLSIESQAIQKLEVGERCFGTEPLECSSSTASPVDSKSKKILSVHEKPLYVWLFSQPVLHLKRLDSMPLDCIPLMAHHPNCHVQELCIPYHISMPPQISQNDVELLFCNHSVRKLVIERYKCFQYLLPHMVEAFKKQFTIRELILNCYYLSLKELKKPQQLMDFLHTVFSLPNLDEFSLDFPMLVTTRPSSGHICQLPDPVAPLVQIIYNTWQKVSNDGIKPLKLKVFKFGTFVGEVWETDPQFQPMFEMLNCMGAKYTISRKVTYF